MGRDGKPTRDNILAQSKTLVQENGFAGTTIDRILDRTGITKGAFFYHFKTKDDLAKALIEEYARVDIAEMNRVLEKTESIEDPLERLLQFVQEFIDMMQQLENPYPGCLYASYNHEPNHFSDDIKDFIADVLLQWRKTFEQMIEAVLKEYKAALQVDKKALADQFIVVFEGGFVVSKALNAADITSKQLLQFKNYLQLLFVKK